ncbi:TOM1-like protein 2 isoform X2 [Aethina tumida]|uniref:TOM1-like protein 2 isoform X2 n=1 Tax=Aethina tumida TaxID=116153 RepID=UPI002147CBC2|nr:TOM1-like protein 2 isoform X2 [Aethina tumida]
MSFLQNALGGNPFSTPVGSRIEQATDASLASENWGLNMEICDLVNETEDGPRDAIKAIRKRLSQFVGKNYTVVMYTLTVLETCVKNCGKRFHVLVCSKDFVQELVKLIGPKNDPPTAVQEKVLSLIQAWADAFRSKPEMSGVVSVYQDLLAKGIEFPPTDLDSLAPIHTPQKSVETDVPVAVEPRLPEASSPSHVPMAAPAGGALSHEQRAKLQSELDVVQSNMNVLGEMLSEMVPGQEQQDELELIQELHAMCRSMQTRLVELISQLANDELTAELLRINDDLNNLFLRYSRWEKNREAGGQSASAIVSKAIPPGGKPPLESNDSLIDFSDDVADQIDKLTLSPNKAPSAHVGEKGDDEFDMFAQSRKLTYENSKTRGSSYNDNLNPDQEASLNTQGKTVTGPEESVTSSEFERFLAERAAAAENLPPATTTAPTTSTTKT